MLTGFGLRSKSKFARIVGRTVVHFFKNVIQKFTAIDNFIPEQHLWHLPQMTVMKNLNEKFTHFRYKEKDQENFWTWFHPCHQTSQHVTGLNDFYKYLDEEWFHDDVI